MYLRESRIFVLLPVRRRAALISPPERLTHTQLDSIVSSATRSRVFMTLFGKFQNHPQRYEKPVSYYSNMKLVIW
jgi:hypothetical protein